MNQEEPDRRGSLSVIFLTVVVDLLGFGMVMPLLPIYADQFAMDPSGWQLGLLMASFSAMQFIFAPLWGMVSDRVGRRPVLMIGLAGSVVFYTLFGLAAMWHSLFWLFITRIGAGIACATIPTAQAYIADSTRTADRTRGMALFGMAFGVGFTFGPLLGLLAVLAGGGDPGPWPGFAAAALSAIALSLAIWRLPESRFPGSPSAARPWIDLPALRVTLAQGALASLLAAYFVCVVSFVQFETTLSLLVKGSPDFAVSPFQFTWTGVCLTFAFIGFTLALVQGGIVRPLSRRVADVPLALAGVAMEIVGYSLVVVATWHQSTYLLFGSLVVIVSGFAFLQPTLHSLVSRWTSANHQGAVLGLTQSLNALARIAGAAVGIPLLKAGISYPYWSAAALIAVAGVLIAVAKRLRDRAT